MFEPVKNANAAQGWRLAYHRHYDNDLKEIVNNATSTHIASYRPLPCLCTAVTNLPIHSQALCIIKTIEEDLSDKPISKTKVASLGGLSSILG